MNLNRILRAGKRYLKDRNYRFLVHANWGLYDKMEDTPYLKRRFRAIMGYEPDLENPRTFNEKLQWLKLHDRRPEYTRMVDKVLVREHIAQTIGEEYLIPLLGVWEDPEDIDFEALPNQFVLKCNHNSGLGMCVCRDKKTLDIPAVKKALRKGLKQDYFLPNREWPYRDVPRKIIGEQYLSEPGKESLTDYKLMCFHGKVKCIFTCTNRHSMEGLRVTFFDTAWNRLPFQRHYPADSQEIPKPASYETMVMLAEKLAENIPFARIDFYEIAGRPYFGEITFFPGGGFEEFTPESADYELGEWLQNPL